MAQVSPTPPPAPRPSPPAIDASSRLGYNSATMRYTKRVSMNNMMVMRNRPWLMEGEATISDG